MSRHSNSSSHLVDPVQKVCSPTRSNRTVGASLLDRFRRSSDLNTLVSRASYPSWSTGSVRGNRSCLVVYSLPTNLQARSSLLAANNPRYRLTALPRKCLAPTRVRRRQPRHGLITAPTCSVYRQP